MRPEGGYLISRQFLGLNLQGAPHYLDTQRIFSGLTQEEESFCQNSQNLLKQ
jgi:hypothetical protein